MSTTMRGTIRTTARHGIARRAIRTTAIGLSGLALAMGAVGCSGSDDPAPDPAQQEPAAEQPADPEGTSEESTDDETAEDATDEESSDPAASDGGGDAAGEGDIEAAKERFVAFLQVVDDADYEAACGYTLDPSTDAPPVDETLQACVQGLESQLGSSGTVQPGTFDAIDPSMIEAEENADGSITVSIGGDPFPLPMVEHTDGQWYFTVEE